MRRKYTILIILMAAAFAISFLAGRIDEVNIKDADLSVIPYEIGRWKGVDTSDDTVPDLTKRIYATNILYRIYDKEGAQPVTVFVSSCKSLKRFPNFKYHFPKYCYVGSGWKIVKEFDEMIPAGDGRPDFFARELILRKGEIKMAVLFYFQTRKTVKITPGIRQRLTDIINRLIFKRSDITVIRVSTYIINNDEEEGVKLLKNFLKTFEPLMTETLVGLG